MSTQSPHLYESAIPNNFRPYAPISPVALNSTMLLFNYSVLLLIPFNRRHGQYESAMVMSVSISKRCGVCSVQAIDLYRFRGANIPRSLRYQCKWYCLLLHNLVSKCILFRGNNTMYLCECRFFFYRISD